MTISIKSMQLAILRLGDDIEKKKCFMIKTFAFVCMNVGDFFIKKRLKRNCHKVTLKQLRDGERKKSSFHYFHPLNLTYVEQWNFCVVTCRLCHQLVFQKVPKKCYQKPKNLLFFLLKLKKKMSKKNSQNSSWANNKLGGGAVQSGQDMITTSHFKRYFFVVCRLVKKHRINIKKNSWTLTQD